MQSSVCRNTAVLDREFCWFYPFVTIVDLPNAYDFLISFFKRFGEKRFEKRGSCEKIENQKRNLLAFVLFKGPSKRLSLCILT